MSRPDYWHRPVQHSRSSFDYGNTRLAANDNHPWAGQFWRSLGAAVLVAATCFAVGMAFLAVGA